MGGLEQLNHVGKCTQEMLLEIVQLVSQGTPQELQD